MNKSIYDIAVKDISGKEVSLADYRGKFLLIVNVASKCGFTPQYQGLEELHRDLKDQVVVMAFPCNQFGAQEPGDSAEIQSFCTHTYDVKFPIFEKIDVNGKNAAPLYTFLKQEKKGLLGTEGIKWNFTKFLVGRDGQVLKRYAPTDKPEAIKNDIKKLL
ncbi:MAG TPA: glutathione peroxidase [Bacteriovoracaceae bacterium]|nr:glutathione peroxidase [Bacteriovoracaceae bacterium]